MKKNFNVFFLFLFLFSFVAGTISAQDNEVEMADLMYSNGKIYVVVAVLSVVLLGLLLFLIRIDRKVKNLENKHRKD